MEIKNDSWNRLINSVVKHLFYEPVIIYLVVVIDTICNDRIIFDLFDE